MIIPFLDLITPHQELEEELVKVFRESLRTASFIGGPQVQGFEREFAQFCETKYCIAVNSGTDALRFGLIASGIGFGDEVVTVPNTFIATIEAISQTGATFAFVDIDEKTYNMDPNRLEDYLKKKFRCESQVPNREGATHSQELEARDCNSLFPPHTSRLVGRPRAVLPVHLYGQPADMDTIREIADRYGLTIIEDACQAHGAEYFSKRKNRWEKAGSMGLAGCFSFYPGKNLGACGEGGAVTTNDENIARKVSMLRDHGQARKYYHEFEGYNGRLDAIQTGILRIKLKHLSEWNEKRRQNASLYTHHLSPDPVITPYEPSWTKAVYHLYVVRVQHREKLQAYLSENGISTGLHYPVPLHLQKACGGLGYVEGDFPVTENVAKEIISLPMFPNLTKDQIEFAVQRIREFYK